MRSPVRGLSVWFGLRLLLVLGLAVEVVDDHADDHRVGDSLPSADPSVDLVDLLDEHTLVLAGLVPQVGAHDEVSLVHYNSFMVECVLII